MDLQSEAPMQNNDLANEERMRKHWLLVTLVRWIVGPSLACCWWVLSSVLQGIPVSFIYQTKEVLPLFVAVPFGILGAGLLYRYAYKKLGTKLLSCFLVFTILASLRNTIDSLFLEADLVTGILLLVDTCLSVWWIFLSFKLRKINKIRKRMLLHV